MQWYNILSLTIGIAAFVITLINLIILIIKFWARKICTISRRKRLEKKLLKKISTFNPSCIVAPSRNGVEIAENILRRWGKSIPICQATVYDRDFWAGGNGEFLFTSKFAIEVPKVKKQYADKILILDDVSITGETLLVLKNYLEEEFPDANIRTCALVADITVRNLKYVPDKCSWYTNIHNFCFCWRK